VKVAQPACEGREYDALYRALRRAHIRNQIGLSLSGSEIEPGVFGIFRPTLLWPAGLSDRLNEVQIETIMIHEVEHVSRRDNLTCAIHALVEALFWFHPLVRWMSKKMTEERERACDEQVMQLDARPEAYAESILKVCGFCLEPPSPCVSGVSGADLKERILRIMTGRSGVALSVGRKVILAAAFMLTLALPLGVGVLHGQAAGNAATSSEQSSSTPVELPKYDVATIKPYKADDGRMMMRFTADGVSVHGMPMREVVQQAFAVEDDRIIGEPSWVKSSRYDIEAKVEPEDAPKLQNLKMEQRSAMMLQLLVDRFGLKYHHEKRELPMYALVIAKGGLKMKPTKPDQDGAAADAPPPDDPPKSADGRPRMGRHMMMMNPGHVESTGASTDLLAHILSRQLGRTVVDKTGLTGEYDFALDYTPENMPMPMPGWPLAEPTSDKQADQVKPSVFTAVEEQLGLKLEATKAMVDVIVIDQINQPSEN
jgi:bla regulator protein BlaR1